MTDSEPNNADDVDVASHLHWSLLEYYHEQEGLYIDPSTTEQAQANDAMDEINDLALDLLTTGHLARDLGDRLAYYQPGSPLENKILDLLAYPRVQERIQFDVAFDVVQRLEGVDRRVQVASIAFAFLLESQPSDTAVKYFRSAARLYLSGYRTEVAVLCGAVVEAALATRLDEQLKAADITPRYPHTGDFSTKQRRDFEKKHPFLDEAQRKWVGQVVTWRNDAIHVQYDPAPDPERPLMYAALLLGAILPRSMPPV